MTKLLLILAVISSANSVPNAIRAVSEPTTLEYDVETTTIAEAPPTYDYIVEIGFNLDEAKIPEYLVDIIYDNASQKAITTDDVFSLYGLKTIDLPTTLDILGQLNIPSENVFSLDGFDKFLTELRVDFKEFYNRVVIGKLNISGNPLRDVLVTLNIDINNFSMAMAYGDPNPYDEFRKGNFSKENVESALQKANRTFSDLFLASRDEFASKALETETTKIIESLLKYGFNKPKALELWQVLNLSIESVYNVTTFKTILNDLSRELNKKPSLGVITSRSNITINRRMYDNWMEDKKVVELFAESITHKFILQINDIVETELENIIVIQFIAIEPYLQPLPYVEIGKSSNDLQDCKFVTLENGTVISKDISVAVNHASYFEIPKGNITELILGSPLICENKVYGIAREINSESIILDSLSAASTIILNASLLSVLITVSVCVYFL